jgi:hypothetical protein
VDPADTTDNPVKPRGRIRRTLRILGLLLMGLALLLGTLWAAAALYFDLPVPSLRAPLPAVYLFALLAIWVFVKRRWLAACLTVGGLVIVLAWWFTLQPSNDRDWQPDVAVLPYADISGNKIELHNIRNCDYRTETDFDVRYYDRTFDLDQLCTVDIFFVYWGSPNIAHTMVSFGFDSGDYICISIETRKEKSEGFSAIKGLFRQFELTYVIADERDLVRLRTNYRQGEEAYLYRIQAPPERVRTVFLDYLRGANSLRDRAEWYNALTSNCTSNIRLHARTAMEKPNPFDWRMIFNGRGDELLYERKRIVTSIPFAELKQRSHINAQARAADKAADFSSRIRQGLPGSDS